MNTEPPAIEVSNLVQKFGGHEAVNGLSFSVQKGRCYGFFGRNGAGKTTTIKCLLNLLRPHSGEIRIFGMNPLKEEVAVKQRIAYVPDAAAFYPWMSVRDYLDYLAAFRTKWEKETERELLERFGLTPEAKAISLSKGQKTQLALIGAICAAPDLLILDEPTSGLDPIVRREFIETVIGAYQSAAENRTLFISTHLISEFEGLIDEFTIIDKGQAVIAMETEAARNSYKRVYARFAGTPPHLPQSADYRFKQTGRVLELTCSRNSEALMEQLQMFNPEAIEVQGLSLEEMFIASVGKAA